MARRARILVVDDDADFVESTKIVLESKNYEVIVAINGDECLRKAKDENPDLILLDVIMPVENGFTAAERLKKNQKSMKYLFYPMRDKKRFYLVLHLKGSPRPQSWKGIN